MAPLCQVSSHHEVHRAGCAVIVQSRLAITAAMNGTLLKEHWPLRRDLTPCSAVQQCGSGAVGEPAAQHTLRQSHLQQEGSRPS